MLKPVAPDPELISWLWSPEGLLWHQKTIKEIRHSSGHFATVKDDHECGPLALMCSVPSGCPYPDEMIRDELRRYGLSGVPREWTEAP